MIGEDVGVHPGHLSGDLELGTLGVVAPPVRQRHHTWADGVGDFNSNTHFAHTTLHTNDVALAHTARLSIAWMHDERATRLTFYQHVDVVHP